MAEETKNMSCGCGCNCSHSDNNWMHHKKHMLKKLMVLIIVLAAFGLGMQLGELKGELRSLRGVHSSYGMMRGGFDQDSDNVFYGSGKGMMSSWSSAKVVPVQQAPVATPSAPAKQ